MLTHDLAKKALSRSTEMYSLLLEDLGNAAREVAKSFQFIAVLGAPRTGGSYLTGELYSALGWDPTMVPAGIAHDGFPEAAPFPIGRSVGHSSRDVANPWDWTLSTSAEYVAMLEIFFQDRLSKGRAIVPKKITKAVYAGGFFRSLLGSDAEYIVTIRHPVACCISTYEKSGGLPADGRFRARGAIEQWIYRDVSLLRPDIDPGEMTYFDAYLKYWENYYVLLAISCITTGRSRVVVPYAPSLMEDLASDFRTRFGGDPNLVPKKFEATAGKALARHSEWFEAAEASMDRVAKVWELAGLSFPMRELAICM